MPSKLIQFVVCLTTYKTPPFPRDLSSNRLERSKSNIELSKLQLFPRQKSRPRGAHRLFPRDLSSYRLDIPKSNIELSKLQLFPRQKSQPRGAHRPFSTRFIFKPTRHIKIKHRALKIAAFPTPKKTTSRGSSTHSTRFVFKPTRQIKIEHRALKIAAFPTPIRRPRGTQRPFSCDLSSNRLDRSKSNIELSKLQLFPRPKSRPRGAQIPLPLTKACPPPTLFLILPRTLPAPGALPDDRLSGGPLPLAASRSLASSKSLGLRGPLSPRLSCARLAAVGAEVWGAKGRLATVAFLKLFSLGKLLGLMTFQAIFASLSRSC